VFNPLFKQALNDGQKDLANQLMLFSGWSDWSEPVRARDTSASFLTAASPSQVRMKIFKFDNGKWRDTEETLRPGDPIGSPTQIAEGTVDFSTNGFIMDIQTVEVPGRIAGTVRKIIRVLVIDGQGNVEIRTLEEDRNSPDLRQLQNQQAIMAATAGR